MGRWLVAVAVLAVLTVVVTIAINMFGSNTRDVQVPDVSRQPLNDATATLQNLGFKTNSQNEPDSEVPTDHVIKTEPEAGASIGAGDEVTIYVSIGPQAGARFRTSGAGPSSKPSSSSRTPASRTSGRPQARRGPRKRARCYKPTRRSIRRRRSRT